MLLGALGASWGVLWISWGAFGLRLDLFWGVLWRVVSDVVVDVRSNPTMKPMRKLCANYAHLAPTCLNWRWAVVGGGRAQLATPPRALM